MAGLKVRLVVSEPGVNSPLQSITDVSWSICDPGVLLYSESSLINNPVSILLTLGHFGLTENETTEEVLL
ncbi:hypothetical protein DPEC_G00115470 [Dallia pectoralis]|uniref:Uncharacterized protein n=1 Tax=Dallia pectoralis TaxID=75939 RepID=A0ACC2GU94_DALPE|nr:hypothetical protein DPEC_G00115470 [Dallia pectoralis]